MADGRKNNSGKIGNKGGRPKREDEVALMQRMDAIAAPDEVWAKIWEVAQTGDTTALKLWANYRFGMPKQTSDVNLNFMDEMAERIANLFPGDE
jgi:hypothetical protein